jgi:hypothetical protein
MYGGIVTSAAPLEWFPLGVNGYDSACDVRKQQYRVGGQIVRTTNVTQSAIGDKTALWTAVLAAAVLL